jgi:1,4-dihydroxy-2-naphthoyl-CoA hydrolase
MIEWKNTLMGALGIKIIKKSDGFITATMPVDNRTCQTYGVLHGGASLALAETVAGIGSMDICEKNEIPCGLSVSGNHVLAVTLGHTVTAKGSLMFKGKTTHVWNVDIRNEEDELVSTVRIVNHIVMKEKGKE